MKKRLLALALCLVMMTSLLPITAAAEDPSVTINSIQITASGLKQQGRLWDMLSTGWRRIGVGFRIHCGTKKN